MMSPGTSHNSIVGTPLNSLYQVGPQIGVGAFGAVHSLGIPTKATNDVPNQTKRTTTSTTTIPTKKIHAWACKVVAQPIKTTRKQNSIMELSYHRLHYEKLYYTVQLRDLCGQYIPQIPQQKQDGLDVFYPNVQGYRVLVMERMDCLLLDGLMQFVASKSAVCTKSKQQQQHYNTMDLGPIAIQLLDICQAIHQRGQLIVDIKSENFMLTFHNQTISTMTIQSLAQCIRMVDLGLLKPYQGPNGHKPNEHNSSVTGNALYCSLHIHHQNSHSRRDDLQSLIFLLGEIVQMIGCINDQQQVFDSKSLSNPFPWSCESSDEATGHVKEKYVTYRNSSYYQNMPTSAAKILYEVFQDVHKYSYSQDPDYDKLRQQLTNLSVPICSRTTNISQMVDSKMVATLSKNSSKKRTKSDQSIQQKNPTKKVSTVGIKTMDNTTSAVDDSNSPARRTRSRYKLEMEEDEKEDEKIEIKEQPMIIVPSLDSARVVEEDGVVPMDIDSDHDDDNNHINTTVAKIKAEKKSSCSQGIKLVNRESREVILMVKGGTESVIVSDGEYSAHLSLDKRAGKAVLRVRNNKKTSKWKCKIDQQNVPPSGTVVFVGAIHVGNKIYDVVPMSSTEYDKDQKHDTAIAANKNYDDSTTNNASHKFTGATGTSKAAIDKKKITTAMRRVVVRVTKGPHNNQTFTLEEGICESVIVGSSPKGKSCWQLDGLAPNHIKLDLRFKGDVVMVKVTALKQSAPYETRINGMILSPGKDDMAFVNHHSVELSNMTTIMFRRS